MEWQLMEVGGGDAVEEGVSAIVDGIVGEAVGL